MKTVNITILFFFLLALCGKIYAQNPTAFEVKKSGKGKKSIIFIPGFASSGEVWDETVPEFEKDYTCYTFTMSGFAGVAPQLNPTFKNWVVQIANFIKDNEIEKPIVVGHSMGGALAMALASDYPNLLEKIVVVDAVPFFSALMNPNIEAIENPECSEMQNQIVSTSPEDFYQMQKASIPTLVANTSKQELVISWSMNSDRETFARMFCDFSNTDLREQIKNIEIPSLILLEDLFKNVQPAIDNQYAPLKTATIKYSNKGLHFIMYDDKDWYLSQLKDFVFVK